MRDEGVACDKERGASNARVRERDWSQTISLLGAGSDGVILYPPTRDKLKEK